MRTQITFNGQETAIEWLLNLSKCFEIKSVKLRSYKIETKYSFKNRCKVEVSYG